MAVVKLRGRGEADDEAGNEPAEFGHGLIDCRSVVPRCKVQDSSGQGDRLQGYTNQSDRVRVSWELGMGYTEAGRNQTVGLEYEVWEGDEEGGGG